MAVANEKTPSGGGANAAKELKKKDSKIVQFEDLIPQNEDLKVDWSEQRYSNEIARYSDHDSRTAIVDFISAPITRHGCGTKDCLHCGTKDSAHHPFFLRPGTTGADKDKDKNDF